MGKTLKYVHPLCEVLLKSASTPEIPLANCEQNTYSRSVPFTNFVTETSWTGIRILLLRMKSTER